jgi:hypothetical protein
LASFYLLSFLWIPPYLLQKISEGPILVISSNPDHGFMFGLMVR